ncbi:DUF262 domain-containing protein [Lachnoanaerobaculum sp. OBRC5-5]|uniref:DUF262 domain-containing protein n=1 Tax=Lachnoanaerobaculum sp. OBRC5-5 TaxID=936595 RepID=UPI0002825458|nr:DUF262 domain-containing protein [Lachnoanaerobaculum sp. OBRC5-5]EJZ70658.1 hypothetical protein HMPREF1135_00427 [Lachnoanaerobaculum sp. OBRC5-5]
MKTITAKPEDIRTIFSREYQIPMFQREYSWEQEQCETLWDDLIDFHNENDKKDKYFLGNIVVHPIDENEKFSVIDGQQRLTTLLLLIRALFDNAGTVKALEECLKTKDKLSSELTNNIRLNSDVIENDKKNLEQIILQGHCDDKNSRLYINYDMFKNKISDWKQGKTSDELNKLILTFLDNVVLLPILCETEDDALNIFETINNRGLSLSDADIFKSKLYAGIDSSKRGEFIDEWNDLDDQEDLFRILMYICRAQENDISREKGLRSYFSSKTGRLQNTGNVMASLKKINAIIDTKTGIYNDSLWNILESYPNQYWRYPLYVFLHKYLIWKKDGELFLPEEHYEEYKKLVMLTTAYYFIKGVVYNSVNTVKDTTFKVCAKIEHCDNYLSEYIENMRNDLKTFYNNLESADLGRCKRGIILLSGFLNESQSVEDFYDLILNSNIEIEHILPRKWSDNNDWDEQKAKEVMETLGNLAPFEKKLNISASNEFFKKKKKAYKESKFADIKDLSKLDKWDYNEVKLREKNIISRIKSFIKEVSDFI